MSLISVYRNEGEGRRPPGRLSRMNDFRYLNPGDVPDPEAGAVVVELDLLQQLEKSHRDHDLIEHLRSSGRPVVVYSEESSVRRPDNLPPDWEFRHGERLNDGLVAIVTRATCISREGTSAEETVDQTREAEQRIANAQSEKAVSLDLAYLGLTTLPESLFELTRLQTLWLGGNTLTEIPEDLFRLKQLETLDVSENRLRSIPAWLGQLPDLTRLFLYRNELMAVPNSLGKAPKLKLLHLSNNQLTDLPESIGKLAELRSVFLENNPLSELPTSLQSGDRVRVYHDLGHPGLVHAIAAGRK